MNIEGRIKEIIRDVPDFPIPGIMFKDITPLLKHPEFCVEITDAFCVQLKDYKADAIVALDSRGFWFGLMIATRLGIPMIPVRKQGKLPYKVIAEEYALEYGTAKVEMHTDALTPGQRVIIHDDLLATGGTASAAANLIKKAGAEVAAYSFLVELSFLGGREKIKQNAEVNTLVTY